MNAYWFTPITHYEPLVLGAERLRLADDDALAALRTWAGARHPRLLPMFKASLLLSDDEDFCGLDDAEFVLSAEGAIVFDGKPFHLSHCAEAFLDRLLTRPEVLELLAAANDWPKEHEELVQLWRQWVEAGFDLVLFREDGMG
ncbi:hypothetical protein [Paenibacillus whitsoniae]|uniref:Uncharacterized protein n=1 Tax=Paenibacillus whitsoniae TaxID=2496558 RepID=A0A430J9N9_9BACL|nr:hypothetical protein [Paenibacillus whitsoniae]RTE07706.1 hypothetical protein EJQ19_20715 [Paenibacillus whitsoniae]